MSQFYFPLRSKLLTRSELRFLSEKNLLINLKDILKNYLIIILSITLSYNLKDSYLIQIIGIICIGLSQYSLMVIGHDGLHGNFNNDKKVNNLINDFLILGMFGTATRVNKHNHIEHHKHTATETDPDRYKYIHKDSSIEMYVFMNGLSSLKTTLENVFFNKKIKKIRSSDTRLNFNEILIIITWQIFLAYLLTGLFGMIGYFIYWLLPLYIFAYRGDLVRVFCEHNELSNDQDADKNYRLITYKPNFIERLIYAPNNMNYHAEHHLYPQIPYHKLAKAHDIILKKNLFKDKLKVRTSYTVYLLRYLKYINANN